MINTSPKSKISDRYWFKDYKEITEKQNSIVSPTHSLCIDCADYYEIPPCKTNFGSDGGCFPSLKTEENFN